MRKLRVAVLLIMLTGLCLAAFYLADEAEESVDFILLHSGLRAADNGRPAVRTRKALLSGRTIPPVSEDDMDDEKTDEPSGQPATETGYWQDVYQPRVFYWLSDSREDYRVFSDKLSLFTAAEELRRAGIAVIEGKDYRMVKTGRIWISSHKEQENE